VMAMKNERFFAVFFEACPIVIQKKPIQDGLFLFLALGTSF